MAVHHDIITVSHQGKEAQGLIIILITGVVIITIMTTIEAIIIVVAKQPPPNHQSLLPLAIWIKGLKLSLQIQRKKKSKEVVEVDHGVDQLISSNKLPVRRLHHRRQL